MKKIFEEQYHLFEKDWWWFVGRHDLVSKVFSRLKHGKILEIGCGSAENSKIFNEPIEYYGVDISLDSIKIGNDVLEHLEDERLAIREVYRVLKYNGYLLILVPAFQFLWDGHDVLNQHRRRYNKSGLVVPVKDIFDIVKISYWNFFLFPQVVLMKIVKKFLNKKNDADLMTLPNTLNNILINILKIENYLICKGIYLPIGVSIFCMCKRKHIKNERIRIKMVEITIVLPAYNEAERIESTVEKMVNALFGITSSFEIIIAEDGSRDGTDKICEGLAKKYNFIVHLHSEERLGRGRALNNAFKISKGDILGYIDVDLATDMGHLTELVQYVRDGCDFVTGSRMLPESNVKRPFKREFASKGFNFITRIVLRSKLCDHQCGFKAFKRESLLKILDDVKDTHWFWDTELFVRAQREGFKVKEFPVNWKHGGATKVNLIKDVFGMGLQIFRLQYEFLKNGHK